MRYHYDLNGTNAALIRDMAIYDSASLVAGQALAVTAGANQACLQDPAAAGCADIAGVLMETPATSVSVVSTGTLYFGKVSINPMTVYLAQYDNAVGNDVDVSSATTAAVTIDTADDNLDGGWVYCNSGTGQGQLGFIGSASTTVMTLDTTAAFGTAPDSTTDIILIRPPFALNKDLDSTWSLLATDEDETGEIIVLENYIQADCVAFGPLRARQHHALSNLHNHGVKFYSDIQFADNVFKGATTMA